MKYPPGKTMVIALGGSVIHPEAIDVKLIRNLRRTLRRFFRSHRFVLIVGGGRLARVFQDAAHRAGRVRDEDKDWLGIHATRMNAHILRTVFRDVADPVVIDKRHRLKKLSHPLTIGSGWRPGWSTDYVAAVLASDFGAKEVVIAGKPAFVYSADPHQVKRARPIPELSWRKYRRMIPKKWSPGMHAPVDPVAARFAERHGIRAVILDGRNLKNFENFLKGKEFEGTVIK